MSSPEAVLDASVTAPWFLPDEATDASDSAYALMRRGAWVFHAPELWLWECGNIVCNAVRRRRLDAVDARLAWSAIGVILERIEIGDPSPERATAALDLALAHGMSMYDAAYLHLAASLRLPLLTADRALGRAAAKEGVRVLAVEELS